MLNQCFHDFIAVFASVTSIFEILSPFVVMVAFGCNSAIVLIVLENPLPQWVQNGIIILFCWNFLFLATSMFVHISLPLIKYLSLQMDDKYTLLSSKALPWFPPPHNFDIPKVHLVTASLEYWITYLASW